MAIFSAHEREVLAALAAAAIPPGGALPGGGPATVRRLEAMLADAPGWGRTLARSVVWALEAAPVAATGRPFSRLAAPAREAYLARWYAAGATPARLALRALLTLVKGAHFDDDAVFRAAGCAFGAAPRAVERPRWLAQLADGRSLRDDETLEADVVVVGTGAGGAAVGYELAARGHAVLFLEEGRYFARHEFTARASEMSRKLYRDAGMTVALGNVAAPVWAGCAVGGTTVINSGTCYRAPERVFRAWRERAGLAPFSAAAMDPHYARVEAVLGVAPARAEHLGGVARVIARGAERLGYAHGPLRRNAPDCDGQGICCFGCPTGAKRSTDVSYVPMALGRGAQLVASARVERVLHEGGRAAGVVARAAGGARVTVRARATVIAGGALMTPVLLLGQGLANGSGMVGQNLSIHPAGKVMALFDEPIEMARGIPQGYAIEQFADEGVMFEGASLPLDMAAIGLPFPGRRFTDVIERYRNLASFGFMIEDTSRGRVRRGPGGRAVLSYSLGDADVARMQRATAQLCEVFLAAGARRVFPSVHGFDELASAGDVARLAAARLRASDLEVTAYHPLGTARMGQDPRASVVGADHLCHDVGDLYVVDGSAVPTALGVNPQLTIMALATRAAEIIDARLSAQPLAAQDASAPPDAAARRAPPAPAGGVDEARA